MTLTDLSLTALALPVLIALVVAAVVIRRRQRLLQVQRRAAQQQRAAEHIKTLAQAVRDYTGRSDIALLLLQQAVQKLEEAGARADNHPLHDTRRDYLALSTALQNSNVILNGADAAPEPRPPVLDSEAALNRARMQLIEAARLLGKAEKLGWVEAPEARQMDDALQQTRRSIELRLDLRQAAHSAAERHDSPDGHDGTLRARRSR